MTCEIYWADEHSSEHLFDVPTQADAEACTKELNILLSMIPEDVLENEFSGEYFWTTKEE